MIGSGFEGFLRLAESKELPGIVANARTEADAKNFFLFIDGLRWEIFYFLKFNKKIQSIKSFPQAIPAFLLENRVIYRDWQYPFRKISFYFFCLENYYLPGSVFIFFSRYSLPLA